MKVLTLDFNNISKQLENAKRKNSSRVILTSKQHQINTNLISNNAIHTVTKLVKAGYKAYIVGGCVRDLLLGLKPKDFDVCTNATPEQIIKVFSNANANIIGRRFKIVHIKFSHEIIEVTTFRRDSKKTSGYERKKSSTGMLLVDNAYGNNIQDDAMRRDFTINALYYDVINNEIIDLHHGLYDLMNKKINMIGDATTRYQEDPVRIIRACRFAAKLNFSIEQKTLAAIEPCLPLLKDISHARMFEEVVKLFLSGHGQDSLKIAISINLIPYIFPPLEELYKNSVYQNFLANALHNSDVRVKENKPNLTSFFFAIMLWGAFLTQLQKNQNLLEGDISNHQKQIEPIIKNIILRQNKATLLSEETIDKITNIWFTQINLIKIANNIDSIENFYKHKNFRANYDFLVLRTKLEPLMNHIVKIFEPYDAKSLLLTQDKYDKKRKRLDKRLNDRMLVLVKRSLKLHGINLNSKKGSEILKRAEDWRKHLGLDDA